MSVTKINDIGKHVGEEICLQGWLFSKRSNGKIHFLQIRDGSGFIQAVVVKNEISEDIFNSINQITQESSIEVTGVVREEPRSKLGYEIFLTNILVHQIVNDYPITLKEHGPEFLMDRRHLWIRSPRQHAILTIRAEINNAIRDFLNGNGFILIEPPILTPSACEGTSNLFELDYFGEKAYLSQTGQLYMEAAAMAFGKVYSFGPTFRAEKSKTRRHLNEFWMIEPEMAYVDQNGNMEIQENLIEYIVQRVLKNRKVELERLNRDIKRLENIKAPFPKITYDEAVEMLRKSGVSFVWGDDFGAPDETFIANSFVNPVFVTEYPTKCKAFYMQPSPKNPKVVLNADLLAPEGYGEIIGGSQRIHNLDRLLSRMEEEKLPKEIYDWYIDLRKYGSVPHSGFGLGLERTVAWICNIDHVRETIPFARTLNRLTP